MLTPINHGCSSKEMMEQSLPDITHFSEYPPFSISSGCK